MLAKHDFWGLQYIYDDEKEDEPVTWTYLYVNCSFINAIASF